MTIAPLSTLTVLELCAGIGAAVFTPDDRERIMREAELLAVQVSAPVFRRPMVGKVA